MKSVFIFMALIFVICHNSIAQNWSTNWAYSEQYYIEDRPINYPFAKFDNFGNYRGMFQQFKVAHWHRSWGNRKVYYQDAYGNWYYEWQEGYYYWFEWRIYDRWVG